MNKSLIETGDSPILKQVCAAVKPGEFLDGLMGRMERACKKSRAGVGIAAPQVGVAKRLIFTIVRDPKGTIRGEFFINPEIIGHSQTVNIATEGCLSYPGIWKRIKRHDAITLKFQRTSRAPFEERRFEGFHARVLQHEVDHLSGICLIGDPGFAGESDEETIGTVAPMPKSSRFLPHAMVAVVAAISGFERK
jgi:peptide deformylase